MRFAHKSLLLCAVPLSMLSAAAVGGLNGIDVTITNDGTQDVMVTVYDTSTRPVSVVLASERINGFTRIPVSLAPDENGFGNLAWTAVSTDSRNRKCGHDTRQGLSDATSVHVRADSQCGPG